jgi:hypothetical protein
MGWLPVALLLVALALLAGAEWPRLQRAVGSEERAFRGRKRRKAKLRLLSGSGDEEPDDPDAFAASVERDLANLPTIEERDRH